MTSFVWEQKPYLLVADIGDNFAAREQVSYTIIPEPDIQDLATDDRLAPVRTQTFTYPEGPRDSEAIAVDAARGEILVLTKRTQPPELYRLPLNMGAKVQGASDTSPVQIADKIGSLGGFEKPDVATVDLYGSVWSYLAMPTGMSLSGDRLLVTTLEDAFLFDRKNTAAPPQHIPLPYIGQREAITFAGDKGGLVYVTHERKYGMRHAQLLRVFFNPSE
jgi:sugar lactone lactonase YvrE